MAAPLSEVETLSQEIQVRKHTPTPKVSIGTKYPYHWLTIRPQGPLDAAIAPSDEAPVEAVP